MDADVLDVQEDLGEWMEKTASGLDVGRFRFCLRGNLTPVNARQALFATCFAMKAAWQAGLWDTWPEERRQGCIEFVRSFQQEDGHFVDPWLRKASRPKLIDTAISTLNRLRGRTAGGPFFGRNSMNTRAETRQSASTLLMVKSTPIYPLPVEFSGPRQVRDFIQQLDWENPWAAGSHLSHVLFMLSVNRTIFNREERYDELVSTVTDFLSSIRDPSTQCWYRGNPPGEIKISGAMKVLSGLQWLNLPYPDCSRLLDFALSQAFETDGCGFLNRLFVVHEARKGTPQEYRSADINSLAERSLRKAAQFRKADGGFSFFEDRAQTSYYGARVSEGHSVSDLHGATMISWAIGLCENLRISSTELTGTLWRPHKA